MSVRFTSTRGEERRKKGGVGDHWNGERGGELRRNRDSETEQPGGGSGARCVGGERGGRGGFIDVLWELEGPRNGGVE
jgi:hypothetical protein